jgi:uncharacterized protein YqhQ
MSKFPISSARPYIGGQAVLEGVMMRAPTSFAIVVRRKDGSLHVRERAIADERTGLRKWPLVRGVVSLVESLKLGNEALRFSAEQYEKDLDAEAAKSKATGILSALGLLVFMLATRPDDGDAPASGPQKKESRAGMGLMLLISLLFFIALPQAAAAGVNKVFHLGFDVQAPAFQAMTGVFKLMIVVGYLLAIRRVPDIYRVFQYHGAEHKTISTYEAGEDLTVANARTKTTLHPRCGTTFLVMVALVSIFVFTGVGALLPRIHTGSALFDNVIFFFEKLPFVPVIAAVTFEMQRVFARYFTKGPLRVVLLPGFLVQKITTIEPDDQQLEVALGSLRTTLFREEGRESGVDTIERKFAGYEALLEARQLRGAA